MMIALALLVVLFQVLTDGLFLQPRNVTSLLVQNGYILILAIGMVMVIIAGHIDLSVGSVCAFVGATVALAHEVTGTVPWYAGHPARPRGRHPRGHVAGLLGGLLWASRPSS